MTGPLPWITRHAIDRYVERVDASASCREAGRSIAQILRAGRARPTPRHWMRKLTGNTPGLRFVYWAEQADVCLLVRDRAVVTILTRTLFRPASRPLPPVGGGWVPSVLAGAEDEDLVALELLADAA